MGTKVVSRKGLAQSTKNAILQNNPGLGRPLFLRKRKHLKNNQKLEERVEDDLESFAFVSNTFQTLSGL